MLDIDYCCEDCLKEGILRRFLFYPNHTKTIVKKMNEDEQKANQHCSICRCTGAQYEISIMINSLDMKKAEKEREKILEARRNASDIKKGIKG